MKRMNLQRLVRGTGYFSLVLFSVFSFPVPAGAGTDRETELTRVIRKVEEHYKAIQDFQADFVQIARILSYPEDQRSEGKVYIKRKRMMRWDYQKPSRDQYFIRGDTVIFYSPETGQARRAHLGHQNGIRSPLVFFEGLLASQSEYSISIAADSSTDRSRSIILRLDPKNREKEPVLKILLYINRKDYHIERIDQFDLYGNVTELYFRNIRLNQNLPDQRFEFEAPGGVEVIDQP